MKTVQNILCFIVMLIFLASCTTEKDKAIELGFTSIEEMNYLQKLGYKNYQEFLITHPYSVESNSSVFAESEIGLEARKIFVSTQLEGENKFLGKDKNVSVQVDSEGLITQIEYFCQNTTKSYGTKINNIGCISTEKELEEYILKGTSNLYCSDPNDNRVAILVENNSYFVVSPDFEKKLKIVALGISKDSKNILFDKKTFNKCSESKLDQSKDSSNDKLTVDLSQQTWHSFNIGQIEARFKLRDNFLAFANDSRDINNHCREEQIDTLRSMVDFLTDPSKPIDDSLKIIENSVIDGKPIDVTIEARFGTVKVRYIRDKELCERAYRIFIEPYLQSFANEKQKSLDKSLRYK